MFFMRDERFIVGEIMEKAKARLQEFLPEEVEMSHEFDFWRSCEGYGFFWIKDLERAMRMPKHLYVYFGGDYLRTYEKYDENAREALIEKCIKKIKEEYLIFAEDTSKEEKNVYFKQVETAEKPE